MKHHSIISNIVQILFFNSNAGSNLVFALRTKTEIKSMTEIKRIGFGHRFDRLLT